MMFVRKRLFFWLVKAYLRRWGKRIFFFFLVGLALFFALLQTGKALITRFPVGEKQTIGVRGAYTIETLPSFVFSDLSMGLTTLSSSGVPQPGAAASWKIENNGKKYIFNLKKNLYFNNGSKLTAKEVNYSFKDVTVERPDDYTLIFTLKDSYSPFLVTVTKPIFKQGFVGLGEYKIKKITSNGNFVDSFTIASIKNTYKIKQYRFYPTEEALKIAFLSGEVSKTIGLSSVTYKNTSFTTYKNVSVSKSVDYTKLVTLFFNTTDPTLSDVKIRNALSYAIPGKFSYGERAYSPIPPYSWAYTVGNEKEFDKEHASLLLQSSSASDSANLSFTIKTLPRYKSTAEDVAASWKEIGVNTTVTIVDSVPTQFQIFLSDFTLPRDPDQYTLWHIDQPNNITQFSNLRIDKLLEDGRTKTDITERTKIYADFQKYLIADSPAIFLYFPYSYDITRK